MGLADRYRQLLADIDEEKKAAVAAERERCAKIAEAEIEYQGDDLPRAIDRLEYSHQFARNQLRKKISAAIRNEE